MFRIHFLCLIFGTVFCSATAQEQNHLTPDWLLRHRQSAIAEDLVQLEQIQGFKRVSQIVFPNGRVALETLVFRTPNRLLVQLDMGHRQQVTLIHGTSGWRFNLDSKTGNPTPVEALTLAAVREIYLDGAFPSGLTLGALLGFSVEEQQGSQEAEPGTVLKLDFPDGFPFQFHLDRDFRLSKYTSFGPGNQPIKSVTWQDYRQVGGLWLSFSQVFVESSGQPDCRTPSATVRD